MELTSFEKHIGSTILQRGKAYYEDGHVESLEEVENGVWNATVLGSEDYFVEIEISKRGTVKDYECDCPYDGDLCKHVVALMYAVRDEQKITLEAKEKDSKRKKTKLSFQKLLNKISADELKAFILHYSKKSNSFKSDFELFFAEKDENFDIEKQVRDQIRKTIKTYSKRQFVDYGSSSKLARELDKILMQGQYYLSKKNLLDASTLSMVYIKEAVSLITYADDSNGYLGDAIDSGISLLTDVAVQAPLTLKEKIAGYLNKELQNELYFDYGNFGYDMTDLYAQLCLDLGNIDDFIHFADLAIEKSRHDRYDYRSSFFIELKASILKNGNRTDEAEQLMEQQIHLPKVRKMAVEREIEHERLEEAKKLLAEGIRIAEEAQHPGTVREWEETLLRIAGQEKDITMVRFFTEKFAFGRFFDSNYYQKWKNTYSTKEWPAIIEKKILAIQKNFPKDKQRMEWGEDYRALYELGPIYVEEKMYDRLLGLIERQSHLNTILGYHEYLYKVYPAELMKLYQPLLDKEAESANDRSAYRRFLEIVLSIYKDIPTGRQTLKAQMLQWKMVYRNRPAMMDELNKVLDKINVQGM